MNKRIAIAIAISLLMLIPAGAFLGVHYSSSGGTGKFNHSTGVSELNPFQTLEKSKTFMTSRKLQMEESLQTSTGGTQAGFQNLTSQYEASLNGTIGINSMASNAVSVGYIGVMSSGGTYIEVINVSQPFTTSERNYTFEDIYPYQNYEYLVLGFNHTSSSGTFQYFVISDNYIEPINFQGLNATDSNFLGFYNGMAFMESYSGTNNYLNAFYPNGTLAENLTSSDHIPTGDNFQTITPYGGAYYLGGSNLSFSGTNEISRYLVSQISGNTYKIISIGGNAAFVSGKNGTGSGNYDAVFNIIADSGNLFAVGGEYYYNDVHGFNSSVFKTLSDNFTEINISTNKATDLSDLLVHNSIPDTPIQASTVGNVSLIIMQAYYDNLSSSNGFYYVNYEYLLNDTNGTLQNITYLFSPNIAIYSAVAFNGNFYLGIYDSNMDSNMLDGQYANIQEYNLNTNSVTVAQFSPSTGTDSDSPTYWVSHSVSGDNGVLTVGGDGFDFYHNGTFVSSGQISLDGFLLGAAWNGNEFLLVGQKYFEDSYPSQGVLAYMYYPGNNTIMNITSEFPSWLSVNATLISVANISGNFLIQGIANTSTTANPLLFLYNTTTGKISSVENQIPAFIHGVNSGEIVSANGYAYAAYAWSSGSTFIMRYHNNTFGDIGPNVTQYSLLSSYYAAYQINSMYTNGSSLFIFGHTGGMFVYQKYSYNTNEFSATNGYVGYPGGLYYVTGYDGNVIIFGNYTGMKFSDAYGFNVSDGIFSIYNQVPSLSTGEPFSAVQYDNSIFLVSGDFGSVYYGVWNVNFSAFNTGMYRVTFNYPNLSKIVKSNFTWTVYFYSDPVSYVNSSNNDTISMVVPEGMQSYDVYLKTQNEDLYLLQGTVDVNRSMEINISNPIYNISFNPLNYNSNLEDWGVFIQGFNGGATVTESNSSPIVFYVPSGIIYYTVLDKAYGTNHTLIYYDYDYVNSNQTVNVSFPTLYRVNFVANPVHNESWFISLNYGHNSTYNITTNNSITQYLPNGTYSAQFGILNLTMENDHSISFKINGSSTQVNISLPEGYSVKFQMSNLPWNLNKFLGWDYTVKVNSFTVYTSSDYSSNVTFAEFTNGTYNISFRLNFQTNNGGYFVTTAFSNVTVKGSNQTVSVISASVYNVSLLLKGLPVTDTYSYNVLQGGSFLYSESGNSSVNPYLYLPNGSFTAFVSENSYYYVEHGIITDPIAFKVNGGPLVLEESLYNISFNVTGIANHANGYVVFIWNEYSFNINLNSEFYVFSTNVTFNYTISEQVNAEESSTTIQYNGQVNVSGSSQNVNVYLPDKFYTVQFKQVGLPNGYYWNVYGSRLNSANLSVNFYSYYSKSWNSTVLVMLVNGTYQYEGSAAGNYYSNTSSFTVDGKNLTLTVYYSDKIILNFDAFNLPQGLGWSVVLDGKEISTTSTNISYYINDTAVFNFTVNPPAGYTATPGYGTINLTSMRVVFGLQNRRMDNITVIFNNNSVEKYGYVGETLNLLNGSIMRGAFLQSPSFHSQLLSYLPLLSTFDPVNGNLYVTALWSNPNTGVENGTILIINASDYSITGRISLGDLIPYEAAYDPLNGNVFVTAINAISNSGSHQSLVELNVTTNAVSVLNVSTDSQGAFSLIYDSFNNMIYVTTTNGLVSINPSTLSVNGYINITSSNGVNGIPQVVQGTGDVVFVSGYGNNITEINASSGNIIRNITLNIQENRMYGENYLLYETGSLLFDAQNNEIYIQAISNSTSGNYTSDILVFGTSGTLIKTISVPLADSYQMSLDEKTNDIWITSYLSLLPGEQNNLIFQGIVTELNASNNEMIQNLSTGFTPVGVSYDGATGSMIITNVFSSTISIIGSHFVHPELYSVTFSESGLPSGTTWYVNLSNGLSYSSTGDSITLYLQNGTYSYAVSSVNKSFASQNYTGTMTIDGTSLTKIVDFHLVSYTITFAQTGLPVGVGWYVNISGEPGSGLLTGEYYNISLPNGTYMLTVASSESQYKAEYNDEITVSGSNLTVNVVFSNVKFGVQFKESGLPSGTEWYVNITGYPTSGPISSQYYNTSLQNGTYYYSVSSVNTGFFANAGEFSVNGHSMEINVSFQPRRYGITFTESGLPSGTAWYVNISGLQSSGPISSSYTVNLTDGNYTFTSATTNNNYRPFYDSSFSVNGNAVSIKIIFKPVLYAASFSETGLPTGVSWYVNLSNGIDSGPITGSSYSFSLINGTYSFTVASSNKIYEPVYVGKFSISGSNVSNSVQFTKVTFQVTFTEKGLPVGTLWTVNLSGSVLSSTTSTITFTGITNGTYAYNIPGISGYFSSISTGTLTVNGHSVTMGVAWNKTAYVTTFKETGLPEGSTWYVNITGHPSSGALTGNVFSISLPNGTYSYAISTNNKDYASPGASFTVLGQSITVPVVFHSITYALKFVESGLPSGTIWNVTVDGHGLSSTSSTITFQLINGSYTYSIAGVAGYHTSHYSSSVTISGSDVTIQVSWSINIYNVTFKESGLPSGTQWNISFDGAKYSNTTGEIVFHVPNGTYTYSVNQIKGYTISYPGIVTVAGSSVTVTLDFVKNATVYITVATSGSTLTVNGVPIIMNGGSAKLSMAPGYYFINVSKSGYYTFTNLYDFHSSTYYINVTLKQLLTYGYLNGTVSPGTALISASGIDITVLNGSFNQSLSPGVYIVSVSAAGYLSASYEVNITKNAVTNLRITLAKATESYTISGYVNPDNSSVMFGGYIAYVNSTGYYTISLPSGTYKVSVTATGYFSVSENYSLNSNSELNFTLVKEPAPTSVETNSTVVAAGYNVTVSNLTTGSGNISLTYNASANGTLTVELPYNEVKNATLSDIMNSTVYVDGVKYTNYTLALSANNGTFSVILTVYGLKGDPTLIWAYSPAVKVVPPLKPNHSSPFDQYIYIIIGVAVALIISISAVYLVRRKRQ